MGASFGGRTSPASSECVMIKAPIKRVDTPHEVAQTNSCLPSRVANFTSNARAKFWPRKVRGTCLQRLAVLHHGFNAVRVEGTGKPLVRRLDPFEHRHGHPAFCKVCRRRRASWRASATASSEVSWAVCPSCQRNSAVRRNSRVRISQRTTLAHWFTNRGQITVTLDPPLVRVPNDGF